MSNPYPHLCPYSSAVDGGLPCQCAPIAPDNPGSRNHQKAYICTCGKFETNDVDAFRRHGATAPQHGGTDVPAHEHQFVIPVKWMRWWQSEDDTVEMWAGLEAVRLRCVCGVEIDR